MADIDEMDEPETLQDSETEEKELEFAKSLIGLKITDVHFTIEGGYMIEFDNRIRFRSCCEHAAFYRRIIQ